MPYWLQNPFSFIAVLNHDELSTDTQGREELARSIRDLFGADESISGVFRVGEGANAAHHFVAHTSSGVLYGLKAARRLPRGALTELLLADLAETLGLPHVCRTREIAAPKNLRALPVPINVTRWMPNGCTLNRLPAADLDAIHSNLESFMGQFGQWMAFGLLFGIRDRHDGNWVWSSSEIGLAMIDLEEAFTDATIAEYRLADRFLDRARMRDPSYGPVEAAKRGITRVFDAYSREDPNIRRLLSGHPDASGFASRFVAANPADVHEQWVSALA